MRNNTGGAIKKVVNALTTYFTYISLRMYGVKIGKQPRFCGLLQCNIAPSSTFEIGDNLIIVSGGYRNEIGRNSKSYITLYDNSKLKIGDYVGMSDVTISCRKEIIIGDYVTIGGDVLILDSNAHCLDWKRRRTERIFYSDLYNNGSIKHASIIIGDDVFIGARSIITKGVKIGSRSIIATGSVVVCDIPSDEIWGGNPARFIKKNI